MRPQWTYRAEFWRGGTEQGRKISFLARGGNRHEANRNTFTGWHPVRKVPHTPNLKGG